MKPSVCFLLTALGISQALYAATDAVKNRELHEVQSKIQQVGADVRVLAAEKSEQLEQLRKLEKHFGELINAVNTIKSQIAHQERVLQEVRNKVAATQKDIRTHQRGLEGLIKAVAAMGDQLFVHGLGQLEFAQHGMLGLLRVGGSDLVLRLRCLGRDQSICLEGLELD